MSMKKSMSPTPEADEKEFLRHYDIHDYDIPLVSVDAALFTLHEDSLKVLLVERAEHPHQGRWSLPGGFVDLECDAELADTALRKLKEKSGVAAPWLEQVCSIGNRYRDPRGWSVTVLYMALIAHAPTAEFVGSVRDARWWPIDHLDSLSLAFDHAELIERARDRLRTKTDYTILPIHVLHAPFSLTQLQHAFELILGKSLEKKSFRRRILNAKVLKQAGTGLPEGGRGRPTALYRPRRGSEEHLFLRVFGD